MRVFDEKARGPSETPRYPFETDSRRSEHDHEVSRELLDAMIVRNRTASAIERMVKQAPAKSTGRSRAVHQE